jgi:hypothetical protein
MMLCCGPQLSQFCSLEIPRNKQLPPGTHDNTCTYTRGAPKILRIAVVALQNTSNSFPRREVWMDRGRPPPAPCEVRGKMFEDGRGYVKMTMNSRPPSVRTLYIPYTVTQRPSHTLTLSKMQCATQRTQPMSTPPRPVS